MSNENNNESAGMDERPATEAQVQLCLQLYNECDYKRKYSEADLLTLSRADISKHIGIVKEYKNVQQQLALQNAKVQGFDKITFAMLYKLTMKEIDLQHFTYRCSVLGRKGAFCELYDEYKAVEAAVKKHVAEGGQK